MTKTIFNLSHDFVKYIESTNHLYIYKLNGQNVSANVLFPKVKTLTLINCSKNGVQNMLNPNVFPNTRRINYLSAAPTEYDIHRRFGNQAQWVFPNKNYDFYNYMVGQGLGKKDDTLMKRCIASKKIIDGANGFDISFQFDLNIPEFGIISGEWWRGQFVEYLQSKEGHSAVAACSMSQDDEELEFEKNRVKFELDNLYFEEEPRMQ
jgi:hypothetical protein